MSFAAYLEETEHGRRTGTDGKTSVDGDVLYRNHADAASFAAGLQSALAEDPRTASPSVKSLRCRVTGFAT